MKIPCHTIAAIKGRSRPIGDGTAAVRSGTSVPTGQRVTYATTKSNKGEQVLVSPYSSIRSTHDDIAVVLCMHYHAGPPLTLAAWAFPPRTLPSERPATAHRSFCSRVISRGSKAARYRTIIPSCSSKIVPARNRAWCQIGRFTPYGNGASLTLQTSRGAKIILSLPPSR